jgi:hypothetical protein
VLALLLLAAALGLDNLAAAIGFGVAATGRVSGGTRVRIAVVFGLFEAGMPVLGLVLGHGLADSIGAAARWLGGAALIVFGVAGLVQARRESGDPGHEDNERAQPPQRSSVQPIGRLLLAGLVLSGDNVAPASRWAPTRSASRRPRWCSAWSASSCRWPAWSWARGSGPPQASAASWSRARCLSWWVRSLLRVCSEVLLTRWNG